MSTEMVALVYICFMVTFATVGVGKIMRHLGIDGRSWKEIGAKK